MARLERKAYYVGTWREDVVTDTIMRQIIARSHAEKGQKVKVKLSKTGIGLSRTVVFQESYVYSFPLSDVYFLTVNQRHPTCLLCIAADPVRKYLILALRTLNEVEAQEIISTFHALKENPSNDAGNVVLRRKDNGNWTLRDRSQHNANRHMQEIFKESTPASGPVHQPNGHALMLDVTKENNVVSSEQQDVTYSHFGSKTVVDDSETQVARLHNEVEHMSQELQDIKFVLEKAGTVSSSIINNNHQHNNKNSTEKSHYVLNEVHAIGGGPQLINSGLVSAHSEGGGSRPGEARVCVEDHRESRPGMVRAQSAGSTLTDRPALVISNGRVQRQITVPEPVPTSTIDHTDSAATPTTNEYTQIPAYTVQRRVSTEYVQMASGVSRKPSNAESTRSSLRVKFDPEAVRRSQARHHQFRSVRASRSGVPTTIVRPIEQIYAPPNGGVVVLQKSPPSILKRKPVSSEHHLPTSTAVSTPAVYISHPNSSTVYGAQPPSPTHHSHPRRRSRPNSIHVMDSNELKVFHRSGELDDVLL